MVSLKQKQSGFTLVEILIVIVIIGILAGLVITQILGANAKARDTERKTDVNSIVNQLEAYYAKSNGYPTNAKLNDATWRKGNEISSGDSDKSFKDPQGNAATLADAVEPAVGQYGYTATPAGCETATSDTGENTGTANPCKGFMLRVRMENTKEKDAETVNGVLYYTRRSAN